MITKDEEDMSETEKTDKKWIERSANAGMLGFLSLCFFHVYNFFLILSVGMATDTLVSTTGKAALFEVLWIMIKCEYLNSSVYFFCSIFECFAMPVRIFNPVSFSDPLANPVSLSLSRVVLEDGPSRSDRGIHHRLSYKQCCKHP